MALAAGPTRASLSQVHTHARVGGGVDLYQRESTIRLPSDGVSYHWMSFDAPDGPPDLAVAVDLSNRPGGRWFAWREETSVGGGVGETRSVFVKIDPVPTGLNEPTLYPVGWQSTDERATFVSIGRNREGEIALGAVTFAATGEAGVKRVPLALRESPSHFAVRARPHGESFQFDVVMGSTTETGTHLLSRQTVTPDTGMFHPLVRLAERTEPIVALATAPLGEDVGVVDALLGPSGSPPVMTFLRLPADDGDPKEAFSFVAPMTENGELPSEWAISRGPLPVPVVAAKLGDRIIARRLSPGSEDVVLAENSAQAGNLKLVVVEDSAWAIWADPATGIQYKKVP